MPCGCEVENQYLPLNGGDRRVECNHAVYTVHGKKVYTTEFSITSRKAKKDGEGVPEQ